MRKAWRPHVKCNVTEGVVFVLKEKKAVDKVPVVLSGMCGPKRPS